MTTLISVAYCQVITISLHTKLWLIGLCLGLAAGIGFAVWQSQSNTASQPQAQSSTAPEAPREFAKAPAHEDLVTDLAPSAKQDGQGPLAAPQAPVQGATPQDILVRSHSTAKSEVGEPVQWTKPLALPQANPTPPDPTKKPELWVDIKRTTNPPTNPIDVGAYQKPDAAK